MLFKADRLLFIGILCLIIGLIIFIVGPYIPIPSIIPLAVASLMFIIAIITVLLAICNYQRGYARSRGRDVF